MQEQWYLTRVYEKTLTSTYARMVRILKFTYHRKTCIYMREREWERESGEETNRGETKYIILWILCTTKRRREVWWGNMRKLRSGSSVSSLIQICPSNVRILQATSSSSQKGHKRAEFTTCFGERLSIYFLKVEHGKYEYNDGNIV